MPLHSEGARAPSRSRSRESNRKKNPNYVPLDIRKAHGVWNERHGVPAVDQARLDEASSFLRALHDVLPLDRVQRRTKVSKSRNRFARSHGVRIVRLLEEKTLSLLDCS